MTSNIPKPNESKALQFHQIVNIALTVIIGSGITGVATFFYSVNNSVILLTSKLDTASHNLEKLSNSMERRIDKLEDRIRQEEIKR